MSHGVSKRVKFRPAIGDHKLEDRVVLSGTAATAAAPVVVLTPAATPAPAAAPTNGKAIVRSLKKRIDIAYKDARADLRKTLDAAIKQMYAGGAKPDAQTKAAAAAQIDGAVDAAAVAMAAPASILPGSSAKLVPALESHMLDSLTNQLNAITQSPSYTVSAQTLESAVNQAVNTSSTRALTNVQNFLTNTPLNSLSVSNGVLLPVQQYMGVQVVSQLENNLRQFAVSYPSVAAAIVSPATSLGTTSTTGSTTTTAGTGTTGVAGTSGSSAGTSTTTALDQALGQANGQAAAALQSLAFVLGSELELFPGSSSVVSQFESALSGGATASTNPTTTNATSSALNSLATELASLQPTASTTGTAAATALSTGLASLVTPVATFLSVNSPADLAATSGNFSSAYASGIASPTPNGGFSVPYLTASASNLSGVPGSAATTTFSSSAYTTNYGSGFSTLANLLETSAGFPPGNSLAQTTVAPGQTSLLVTGAPAGTNSLSTIYSNSPGQVVTIGSLPTTASNTTGLTVTTVGTTSPGQTTTI